MARVTVEDCVTKIPNRFELVMAASQRARDLSAGAEPTIDRDNDKHPVIALREIADDKFSPDELREALVLGLQRHAEVDEPEEEAMELPSSDSDLLGEIAASGQMPGMQVVGAGAAGAASGPDDAVDGGDD